jgi:hypothetical protein
MRTSRCLDVTPSASTACTVNPYLARRFDFGAAANLGLGSLGGERPSSREASHWIA